MKVFAILFPLLVGLINAPILMVDPTRWFNWIALIICAFYTIILLAGVLGANNK